MIASKSQSLMEASIALLSQKQIHDFFTKNPSPTQQECDEEAERITGTSVYPTPVQGASSYTVTCGECVVQFRGPNSVLDVQFITCVEQALRRFHAPVGTVGEVHIYTMNNIGGVSAYLARYQLQRNDCFLLRQTLQDYARFFASAWHNMPAQMTHPSRESLFTGYSSKPSQLSEGLPSCFRPIVNGLIDKLPGLFADDWPLVPNHTDLLESNIHVDPNTGRLTGICDWRDTEISPFGMSLGGLEIMLGIQDWNRGWLYHANHHALRGLFYEAFWAAMGPVSEARKERIEVARLVGLFLQNGFKYEENGNLVPAAFRNEHHQLRYLAGVMFDK